MGYLRPISLGALLARHAPFNLWFLSIGAICLCFLDIVKQSKRSDIALYVMLLGIGYFILTLHWIAEPFFVDFRSHAWIAPFAIFFISVAMAFFWYAFSYIFAPFGARWALLLGIATAEYFRSCLLYTSPSPRDRQKSRMPSSA